MSFISNQIKDSSEYHHLADQAADEIEALEKQEGELRDHIKQLEQQLAEVKKSIKSVIQHYEDGEVYFERNYEAFYTDSFQDLMVDIYKKHGEADLVSQTHRPTNLNSFIQKHVHVDGNDAWTYNSLARSAQDFIDSAVEAFESQAQQPVNSKVIELLKSAVKEIQRNTCSHEETHRGGAIWEICDICGCKWADDEGGKPEFVEAKIITDIQSFLSQSQAQQLCTACGGAVSVHSPDGTYRGECPFCSQAQQESQWISLRNDDYSHLKGNELIYAYRHGQGIFEARLENYRVVSDVIFNRNVNGVTHIMLRPPLPLPPSTEKVFNDEIHRPWSQPPAPEGGEKSSCRQCGAPSGNSHCLGDIFNCSDLAAREGEKE